MLEADKINLVPPPETTFCEMCGVRYGEPGVQFAAFDNKANDSEDLPAGLIETYEKKAGVTAYRARDVYGGGTTTIQVHQLQQCSHCAKQAAALFGYGDTGPLKAEVADLREQLAATRKELQQSEVERIEANEAVRHLSAQLRAFSPGPATGKPPKPAAGKRQTAKAS